jgi:hypothetical protein
MRYIIFAFVVGCIVGCSGADPAPSAHVESATPDSLTPTDDTLNDLTITVAYEDGDGDLGGGTASIYDCRGDDLVTTLTLPMIAPAGVVKAKDEITGTLDLYVDDIGDVAQPMLAQKCSDLGVAPLAAGQTIFCVELTDVAGHTGHGDCTSAITIVGM